MAGALATLSFKAALTNLSHGRAWDDDGTVSTRGRAPSEPEPEPDDGALSRTQTKRNADGLFDLFMGPRVGLTRDRMARKYAEALAEESYHVDNFRLRLLSDDEGFMEELRNEFEFKKGDLVAIAAFGQNEHKA